MMQGDDIREQIEALREEVRGLSTSILYLRQDDMRKVFGDQIRPILVERIGRHHFTGETASIDSVEKLKGRLSGLVDSTITIFQSEGRQKALEFLSDHVTDHRDGEESPEIDGFEEQILAQLREYLLLSEHAFNQRVPDAPNLTAKNASNSTLSPQETERFLAPLSNARRVQVMMVLSRENNSLAELSKELDLKKGHLQFHLKALMDVDYIRFDRKSRLYSMSPRGTRALDGVTKLVERISGDR